MSEKAKVPNESGGHESLVTVQDVRDVANEYAAGTDPLRPIPMLQVYALNSCQELQRTLEARGIAAGMARSIAAFAYELSAICAGSVRRSVWRELLPR